MYIISGRENLNLLKNVILCVVLLLFRTHSDQT